MQVSFQGYALKAFLLLLLAGIIGCSSNEKLILKSGQESFQYYEINDGIDADEDMALFLDPYVRPVRARMNRVLTISEGIFSKNQPEGALGNLTADIVRSRATYEMRARVDIAILNNSGLRMDLPQGEITVGHVYELMPYENYITVLKFSGEQILQLADEIAAIGGEPVSGLRMRIHEGRAADVLVGNRQVNLSDHYVVATNNWLADGGGEIPTLWEPLERVDKAVLIRQALIDDLFSKQNIYPIRDHRLR